jgi:hypothetical protein
MDASVTRFKTLPDGGRLVYSPDIKEVGDRGLPEFVAYQYPGSRTRPAMEVAIAVCDGIPTVTGVHVIADPDEGVYIRPTDIRVGAVELGSVLDGWLAELACRRGPTGRWYRYDRLAPEERRVAQRTIRQARGKRRRKLTPDLLKQVAELYETAPPPKHQAIALAFGVNPRTAQKYIERARAAGLLAPSTRTAGQ